MVEEFWLNQTDKPLFPEILWSRPEQQSKAGSVAVLVGASDHLANASQSFLQANQAGRGQVTLVLPDTLARKVPHQPEIIFAKSNPSGSLSESAGDQIKQHLQSADALLVPGSVGHNSETQRLLLELLQFRLDLPVVLSQDGFDTIEHDLQRFLNQDSIVLLMSLEQLQKAAKHLKRAHPITSTMSVHDLVMQLHDLTQTLPATLGVFHQQKLLVAAGGSVSSTDVSASDPISELATNAAVLLAEKLGPTFEVVTSAAWLVSSNKPN